MLSKADNEIVSRVRAGSIFLPEGTDWVEATTELGEVFVDHPDLDPNPRLAVSSRPAPASNT